VLGGHVVRVFEYGRAWLDAQGVDYDWVVKLDADLTFDETFVETIASRIDGDDWAVFSGTPYRLDGGQKIYEFSPPWHSQGQFKFYNRRFLEQIGGVPQSLGWDCADNILAIEKGWKAAAFRDVFYEMYRQVGGKSSLTRGRIKHGHGCYVLGYSPLYFAMRVGHDLIKPPFILGSISMVRGYFKAMFDGQPRILDQNQRRILRSLLWGSLFGRMKNREFEVFQKLGPTEKPAE
jgi:glycosyltransferase involved in cell wall biosynthesis